MLAAFLTTIFFSISVICGHRSARIIGGSEANFWRLAVAAFFLGGWAFLFGQGVSGETFPLFLLSGLVGIGFGDVALFQALPRLGPRLTLLLTRCLAPPFAAAIEWLWLGTTLRTVQILYASLVLAGIGISLWPDRSPRLSRSEILPGVIFAALAALGDGFGAVLSRKAYSVVGAHAAHIDGATAAFQRIIGGLFIAGIFLLVAKSRRAPQTALPGKEKWRRAWPWVLANGLAGQTIGVSCYQWAFQTTPAGVVLPIVATTPLVAMPITRLMDQERITAHAIVGGIIAVAGVIGLALVSR